MKRRNFLAGTALSDIAISNHGFVKHDGVKFNDVENAQKG